MYTYITTQLNDFKQNKNNNLLEEEEEEDVRPSHLKYPVSPDAKRNVAVQIHP